MDKKTLLVHGLSGSGKDTQVGKLMDEFPGEYGNIGTGVMFRELYAAGDPDGIEAQKKWGVGLFVEDELTYKMLGKWVKKYNPEITWIFVSVVRSEKQIAMFDTLLEQKGRKLDLFIHFKLSAEAAVERLSARRVCSGCKENYHLKYKAPKSEGVCDKCGSELIQREDDQPEKIRNRVAEYERTISPILEEYESRGILVEIDAAPAIDEIYKEFREVVRGEV
jgi:adenylate kinase